MDFLRDLFFKLHYYDWYWSLPEWLREPPGLYVAAAIVVASIVLLPAILLWRWIRGRRRRVTHREARGDLRRQARELLRRGDYRDAGQLFETLGKHRAALSAYRRGGCHAELVDFLMRRGKNEQAKAAAREGELWGSFAELCEAGGEIAEAAEAHEQAGQDYAAAGCYERAGLRDQAARCYLKAGLNAKAAEMLIEGEGRDAAEGLEAAVRATLDRSAARGEALDPQIAAAAQRSVELWLEHDEAGRAYRLAGDSELWELAAPIARDHLPPSRETAEACSQVRAHLAAAEIYRRLGDGRCEALERGEHFQAQEQHDEAARWFEKAEEWGLAAEQRAATGDTHQAAELYARAGDHQLAARLFAETGDFARQREMLTRAEATRAQLEATAIPTQPLTPAPRPEAADLPTAGERYLLRDELGHGGMGVVYRADDRLLRRQVAYKKLPSRFAESEAADQLLAEARAAAQLSHPNIVQVYDAGRDRDGAFFIVMELVEGDTFATLLKQRSLSVRGAILLGRQICSALAHAHDRRIVHRDLKPTNLMWTAEKQVKLTDFGLARAFEASIGQVLTRPAGTPFYMAPEQIRGEPVSPRTDLYALGCVLFELLTGRGPFGGDSSIHHHLNSRPDDPRAFRRDVPEGLAAVILRCLDKDPGQRPESAREVARALSSLVQRRRADRLSRKLHNASKTRGLQSPKRRE